MGEISQTIGKKLEKYACEIFPKMGWEFITSDLSINCSRSTHKSSTAKSGEKKTHGIDTLFKFYNPFTIRTEAAIVECKNHKWSDFIPSNLNQWIEELANTIECASTSPIASPYLSDIMLTTGILLFNSSDNIYDFNKAQETISKLTIPRRKLPIMLYLADTGRLEKWHALSSEIEIIKTSNKNHNFHIIYPSIGGSSWDMKPIITPSYLFSDYILSTYTKDLEDEDGGTRKIDVKAIFSFDEITDDSMLYLADMVNKLQLEAHTQRKQEIHIYFYPEKSEDRERISSCFNKIIIASKEKNYKIKFLENRRLSPVI